MADTRERVLVLFVDAFGPDQLARFGPRLSFLPQRKALSGVLGYSSGAIPTILTGAPPSVHGRMCLFSEHKGQEPSLLSPLRWLGLLPRVVHERRHVRQVVERGLRRAGGLSGYVALHKVPPEHFGWLDLPEREDIFLADRIGAASTFLSDARNAGLSVYSSPWQLPEAERWQHAHRQLESDPPELAFLYAAELDGILHAEGNAGPRALEAMDRIARNLERARTAMGKGGAPVTTLVIGDHGMADIDLDIDPRALLRELTGIRLFVDSTMIRIWGTDADLDRARRVILAHGLPGTFLDERMLVSREVPMRDAPYGRAMFVLREGALFSPSFLGGHVAGMHGYDLHTHSASAAIASDAEVPESVTGLTDVALMVRSRLGLA